MSSPGNYVVPGANQNIGPPGTSATVNAGGTTTLVPGNNATVANVGTTSAAIFDFAIPQGFPGDDATISVGTTTTLPPGNPAAVTNTGTPGAAIFNFLIPEGAPGASGIDVEGLQNKIGIFPALPYTSDTTELATNNDGTPATAIVPDATPPTSSTTPEGTPCWLYTKPSPANTGFNWFMYNPRFGNPTALLPIRKYDVTGKDRVQSVWALVQPAVNTNIYTAGVIALNLYSYNEANPPTSGFYSTRWAYSNTQGLNSGQTGVNLYANYTYLIYAYDAPRINNISAVGVPDNQDWGLRDPYDIYPDVNHIPLQNCVLAFNPSADGTYYRTWDSSTAYTIGQTVIFSGFGLGGTGNGIFYTAVANNNNQAPVSTTGVPNLTHWVPISPQPSSYAQQQILSMNVNGINGTTTGWTAGPLLRVLSMGYTTGPTSTTRTSSVRIVLN
jgi:hypothetical protein